MRSTLPGRIGFSIGAVAVLLLIGVSLIGDDSPPIRSRATLPEDPSCQGVPSTLTNIAREMPFPILLAHTDLANPVTVSQVLVCAEDQVEIGYSSGVLVTLGVNHIDDPEAEWKTIAETYPEFSTGIVRGVPASLADPEKGALGGVDLVEDDVRIIVTGNGAFSLASLIEVAESLSPLASPSPTVTA